MTTKDDERKALEKIRKIVDDLGEDSYLSATFEGCFELAEDNIDNDFCISWKQRFECETDKLYKAQEQVTELQNQIDELNKTIGELEKRIIGYPDLGTIQAVVGDEISFYVDAVNSNNQQILDYAEYAGSDSKEGDAFADAVYSRKSNSARLEQLRRVWNNVIDVIGTH